MVSSRWQKQNFHIRNVGLAIAVGSAILLQLLALTIAPEIRSDLIAALVLVVGVTAAFIIGSRYAKSLVRVLKFEYEDIERDFRLLFKENHIRFNRKSEELAYRYELPGHGLSLTIKHNPVFNADMTALLPYTLVTLGEINPKNQTFAERLAALIDEMAERRMSAVGESSLV